MNIIRKTLCEDEKDKLDFDLIEACEDKDLSLIKNLCLKGARPTFNETIEIIAKPENVEIFNFFWQTKLISAEQKRHVLEYSAVNGNLKLIKFLVENKVDIFFKENKPLALGSQYGHLEVVKFLISKSANITESKALHKSIFFNNLEIVKYLIENIHFTESEINESIMTACYKGHKNIALYLIEKYPSVLKENEKELIRSVAVGGNINLFKELVEKGLNVHIDNAAALRFSAAHRNEEIMHYLIVNHDCNLNNIEPKYKKGLDPVFFEWNNKYIESKKLNDNLQEKLKETNIKINKSKI